MIRVAPRWPSVRQIEGDWYVRSDVVASLTSKHSLLDGRAFAVMDVLGDFPSHARPEAGGVLGFYWRGTRHVSCLELHLGGERPFLLASELSGDEREVEIEKTNADLRGEAARVLVPRDVIHALRRITLENERLYVELTFTNHHSEPIELELTLFVDADFRDLFEVRGTPRRARGTLRAPEASADGLFLSYEGLDGIVRWSEITLEPRPDEVVGGHELRVHLKLAPGGHRRVVLGV
jgi:glycogen debranching enzyme